LVLPYGDEAEEIGGWSIVSGQEPHPSSSDNHKVVKGWVTRMELGLNEIVSAVWGSQLAHTRESMDPSIIWGRLESVHMLQGLGSIISMWQRLFQLKKSEGATVQAHAASIREHADRLTGLGDSPSETLKVAVLLSSLPESYSPPIVSLDTHPDLNRRPTLHQRGSTSAAFICKQKF
jgi:gag-polypeptide of LTR copia-type